jgi:hypothetical protein
MAAPDLSDLNAIVCAKDASVGASGGGDYRLRERSGDDISTGDLIRHVAPSLTSNYKASNAL